MPHVKSSQSLRPMTYTDAEEGLRAIIEVEERAKLQPPQARATGVPAASALVQTLDTDKVWAKHGKSVHAAIASSRTQKHPDAAEVRKRLGQ